jgi:hypothetical protein
MLARENPAARQAVRLAMSLLRDLLGGYRPRDFAVRLWDGTSWEPEAGQPARFTLVLKHPGALRTTLRVAESVGFEVRDVESLREHYALTLRHWVRRLEARHDEARRAADEATYRVWRLFMSGSAYGFQVGRLNVYQALLAKPRAGASNLPLTRADWYA